MLEQRGKKKAFITFLCWTLKDTFIAYVVISNENRTDSSLNRKKKRKKEKQHSHYFKGAVEQKKNEYQQRFQACQWINLSITVGALVK